MWLVSEDLDEEFLFIGVVNDVLPPKNGLGQIAIELRIVDG